MIIDAYLNKIADAMHFVTQSKYIFNILAVFISFLIEVLQARIGDTESLKRHYAHSFIVKLS
jgi:hypothetical protein